MNNQANNQPSPITELPDGSGCFTATVMSREEAMQLPIKERPICFRISSEMYHAVFEAIGAASMCWNPRPGKEVFASEQAAQISVDLCFKIADEVERKTAMDFSVVAGELACMIPEMAKDCVVNNAHLIRTKLEAEFNRQQNANSR